MLLLFFFVKPALDCEEFDLFDPLFKGVFFVIGNFRPYEKIFFVMNVKRKFVEIFFF